MRLAFKYSHLTVCVCFLALLGVCLRLASLSCAWFATVTAVTFVISIVCAMKKPLLAKKFSTNGFFTYPLLLHSLPYLVLVPLSFYLYAGQAGDLVTPAMSLKSARPCLVQGWVENIETVENGEQIILMIPNKLLFPHRMKASGALRLKCSATSCIIDSNSQHAMPLKIRVHRGDVVIAQIRLVLKLDRPAGPGVLFRSNGMYYPSGLWTVDATAATINQMTRVSSWCEETAAPARKRLVALHRNTLQRNGEVLASMVLGDKAVKLEQSTIDMFRDVGLSHVLAASGFNLTVVVAMTYVLGLVLLRVPLLIYISCFLNMLCFVALAGPSPSVTRAATMCAVMLALKMSGVASQPLAVLSLALLLSMLFDPYCVTDIGLQLSYGATAGLIVMAGPLAKLLTLGDRSIHRWFGESVAVVLASQAVVLPIQLNYFWQLGLLFGPANLAISPLLAPITVLGFVSSGVELVRPLLGPLQSYASQICAGVDHIANIPLSLMLSFVAWLYSFHDLVVKIGSPPVWATALYLVSLVTFATSLQFEKHRRISTSIFLLALFALIWRPELTSTQVLCARNGVIIVRRDRTASFMPSKQAPSDHASVMTKLNRVALSRGFRLKGQTNVFETEDAIFVSYNVSDSGSSKSSLIEVRERAARSERLPASGDREMTPRFASTDKPIIRIMLARDARFAASIESAAQSRRRSQAVRKRREPADYDLLLGNDNACFRAAAYAAEYSPLALKPVPRITVIDLKNSNAVLVPASCN